MTFPVIDPIRKAFVDDLMTRCHKDWRYRWCPASRSNPCACVGAANCSGNLAVNGVTQIEWLDWVERHNRRRKQRRSDGDRRGRRE